MLCFLLFREGSDRPTRDDRTARCCWREGKEMDGYTVGVTTLFPPQPTVPPWICHPKFPSLSLSLSQGEDGEAGDPGAVGVPGRLVSWFAPVIFSLHPELLLLLVSSRPLSNGPLCSFAALGRKGGPGGEGRHGAFGSSRTSRSQGPDGGGRSQGKLCENRLYIM